MGRSSGKRGVTKQQVASALQGVTVKGAIAEINKILKASPEQVLPCLAALQNNFFDSVAQQAEDEKDFWPDTYHKQSQIAKYWLGAWLKQHVPALNQELLEKIDKHDKLSVRKLIDFACGTNFMGKLPRSCLSKTVLNLTLKLRYERLGSRLNGSWVQDHVDQKTGAIDWQQGGAFRFKCMDDSKPSVVTHVMHCSGQQDSSCHDCSVIVVFISSSFVGCSC